jgi:hypothetical protein
MIKVGINIKLLYHNAMWQELCGYESVWQELCGYESVIVF